MTDTAVRFENRSAGSSHGKAPGRSSQVLEHLCAPMSWLITKDVDTFRIMPGKGQKGHHDRIRLP